MTGTYPERFTLAELVARFRQYLYLPDPGIIYVTLGAVAANRMGGDPVWLLLVGPPSSGKSEMLGALGALGDTYALSTFTEAGLLTAAGQSGDGGLLNAMGNYGIMVLKDFTSLLARNSEGRGELMAAMREIYDGGWVRQLGTAGGRSLTWEGKAGLIGGVTEVIDLHQAVMASMGERFALYRLPAVEGDGRLAQGRITMSRTGKEAVMREELRSGVVRFFAELGELPTGNEPLLDVEQEGLCLLADFATKCRSGGERDLRTHELEMTTQSEAISRLLVMLTQLYRGMLAIGVADAEAWSMVTRVALDGTPKMRRAVLSCLLTRTGAMSAATLADELGFTNDIVNRALEDLAAHGVVERRSDASHRPCWVASPWALERAVQCGVACEPGMRPKVDGSR